MVYFSVFALSLALGVQAINVNSSGYDENEAKMFASLSSVTYCQDTNQVLQWTCSACKDSKTPLLPGKIKIVDAGPGAKLRIVIGKLKEQSGCLMAFRGSSNIQNWINDLEAWKKTPAAFQGCSGCGVHAGFYDLWESVESKALAALSDVGCAAGSSDNLLYVTGHSLGAALTHLAMFTLEDHGFNIAKTYSFEAPRVGNSAFSDAFENRFTRKFPVFRITHYMDPVVHLPPHPVFGYTHVKTEVFYDKDGSFKVCPNVEDKTCADKYDDVPLDLFHVSDHCGSPLLPNGDFCDPVGCSSSISV